MKPLGWWLRHLHELLESSMTRALDAESLTRRHWQVLNTIALGARTPEQVDTAMAPFVAGEGSMAPKVADLRARGWVAADGTLTADGREAHARVEERIKELRARSMEGIGDDDYRTTLRTLERCAANLEAA
ncbi:MarR family winged helix-turn-helix transcriptional regulator [Amycolatopsis sp. MtRt-6]|uniref:MarR family winged helix-turn-helix transcriptional regulator n=1 Tax=Amycolatopsis sp. MtRt-6 TaxID=2792782 RepID=UPI001A8D7F0A|nr:MarR family winged helix-turn-helix transcriptional regulator [Amycolatopsis sp. MtRt-6]